MRLRALWLVATASFLPAFPALAQFNYSASSDGAYYTLNVTRPSNFPISVLTGAPYSGRPTTKSVLTRADGTRLTSDRDRATRICRDWVGRVRTERAILLPRLGGKQAVTITIIEIEDPVAGSWYLLDTVNRVAHRVLATRRVLTVPSGKEVVPSTHTRTDGATTKFESLGTQTMFGVIVVGRRVTTTYPAGSHLGNDHPVTSIIEDWTYSGGGVTLLSKRTGPASDSVMTMEDFSTAEPDAALFQVPPDYQVVDETGSFQIVIPRDR